MTSNQVLYFQDTLTPFDDRTPGHLSDIIGDVPQVSRLPREVENIAVKIESNFASTAELLIMTAEKLEARAADLKQKARWLLEQRGLGNDLREAASFELTARDEVKSLALVDVGMRQEG